MGKYENKTNNEYGLAGLILTGKGYISSFMFKGCVLPEGFTLDDNFDTSSVTTMWFMFSKCSLPEGFTLGFNFNTLSAEFMDDMFEFCKLPRGINNQYNAETIIEMLKYK